MIFCNISVEMQMKELEISTFMGELELLEIVYILYDFFKFKFYKKLTLWG